MPGVRPLRPTAQLHGRQQRGVVAISIGIGTAPLCSPPPALASIAAVLVSAARARPRPVARSRPESRSAPRIQSRPASRSESRSESRSASRTRTASAGGATGVGGGGEEGEGLRVGCHHSLMLLFLSPVWGEAARKARVRCCSLKMRRRKASESPAAYNNCNK